MSRSPVQLETAVKRAIPRGSGIVLGVSGGIDSMVLLATVHALSAEHRLTVHVAHLDHGLRETSGADAEFVRAAVAARGVTVHLRVLQPPSQPENIEAWGRRERYAFFEEVRRENGLGLIATAHTADDVAETFLMRLVSNKELGSIAFFDERRKVIRPLLGVPRAAVEQYASEHGIAWREDPTNGALDFLRNRVRHKLLPVFREFDPRHVETLAERATAVATDGALLDGWADQLVEHLPPEWGSRPWFSALRRAVTEAPEGLRWRVVERAFSRRIPVRLGRRHGERTVEFILGNGGTLELPGGVVLIRRDGGLHVGKE